MGEMSATEARLAVPELPGASRLHLPTIAAIGVLAYLSANVAHELVGHGGACLLVGGRPLAFSSAWLESDTSGVAPWGVRFEAASGTLANFALGLFMLALMPAAKRRSPHLLAFVWLSLAANLLPAAGYMMVSPLAGFGDWAAFVRGLGSPLPWKLGLTLAGVALSFAALFAVVRQVEPFLGRDPSSRRPRARRLCWVPYLAAGALVFPLSAALNPHGPVYVLTTLAAHLGGSAWLAWAPEWVRGPRPDTPEPPLGVAAHRGWIAAGLAAALFCILVLGPGVTLAAR